ncbi:LLM class flavin-dependent oxidoreductase [Paenibacillus mucilaginosus]|uniref:FMNH2-dependent monooxygenase n=1 Tax=Paenibacillus mucilaginosus (strain KNP414) TaxID=1036673 RepID=F8F9C0_PAEMK|nr:LLM class flavin-dependent oxidoreductase [Paenibacillus mucilaginosus]AEI43048.1 FMNH2-dependent monooxygenase [Paenibacillus mucilaginosus KNP414]MCG7215987.1 LLM class flavin-dependent oxidoreductase [Paenibacillus mucilaginosus]WDM24670.1 LLM class flavin-dependent oxidoreductase [Paenibacillus mucilaginosus]
MSTPDRKLHLNAFLYGSGHHEASWRHPRAVPHRNLDIRYAAEIARTAERGLMDAVFVADGYAGRSNTLEPFTLFSALALLTEHIGLIATVSTTYNEPFHLARQFASLDHISGGRAGWNIVTGGGSAAFNFSREEHPEHSERYRVGEEFVEVVKQLWDSWEDDALVFDKEAGVQIHNDKVHEIHFQGENYRVKGPLNIPRPPQGYPVLVQAGSSESGKELAAKTAEAIFTAWQTLEDAQAFYSDVKSRLARYGRTPDQLLVLPGISPILADTEAEARELEEELHSYINIEEALKRFSPGFGVDLREYPLDGPVPLHAVKSVDEINGNKSRHGIITELARKESLTIRQLVHRLAGARGHFTFTGTPLALADVIEQWFKNGAADGFNVMPQLYPSGLEIFVDQVIPELQNRGLFRTSYEGSTLRDRYGLSRPANPRSQAVIH